MAITVTINETPIYVTVDESNNSVTLNQSDNPITVTTTTDLTLQAANELYQALPITHDHWPMMSTQQNLRHTKALNNLTNIITNSSPPRKSLDRHHHLKQ